MDPTIFVPCGFYLMPINPLASAFVSNPVLSHNAWAHSFSYSSFGLAALLKLDHRSLSSSKDRILTTTSYLAIYLA